MIRRLLLAGMLGASAAAAAPAPPATTAPLPLIGPGRDFALPKGAPVSVHFAPPLGAPIRYMREESDRGGVRRQAIVVRFEATGGGYRMEASAPAVPADFPPRLRSALLPVAVLLDRDGSFTALADPETYWRAVDAFLARLRSEPRDRGDAAALAAMSATWRSLDPVAAAYTLAAAYAPVTVMGRLDVVVGEVIEIPAHAGYNDALPEARLVHSLVFDPASATVTRLRMEVKADYDQAASMRIAERFGDEAVVARLKAKGGRVVEKTVHEVESATGLALFHESRLELVDGGGATALRTVRLTRLETIRVK